MKPNTISPSIITRNMSELVQPTGNVYKTVAILSKRAKQIAITTKEELNGKLADFASTVDNLEEIHENREQIEISKYYERMPKPSSISIDEFLNKKITYKEKEGSTNF